MQSAVVDIGEMPWRIEIFGGLRVSYNGGASRTGTAAASSPPLERFSTRRAAELLGLLAVLPPPQTRDFLLTAIWPDADSENGRKRLKRVLSLLRRDLAALAPEPSPLIAEGNEWLRLSKSVTTNLVEFETALYTAARTPDERERIAHLRRAVDRYRGELLPGFEPEALIAERERLATAAVTAYRQVITTLSAQGDVDLALHYAHRAVKTDPLREETAELLINLLVSLGHSEDARRHYDQLALLWETNPVSLSRRRAAEATCRLHRRRLLHRQRRCRYHPPKCGLPFPVSSPPCSGGNAKCARLLRF